MPIAGLSPDEEPDPRTLQAVAAVARDGGATTVFVEDELPAGLAGTVAREIGPSTAPLTPIERISRQDVDAGATYLTLQRENLAAIVTGLRCNG